MIRQFFIKYFTYFVLGIAFLGIFDTSYLLYITLFNNGECDVLGTSCSEVLTSEYSRLLTIPLYLWGLIYYLTIFILGFKVKLFDLRYIIGIAILSFSGMLFSWYLFYLQSEVIEAWCPLCLVSFGLSNILFVFLLAMHFIFPKEKRAKFHFFFLFSCLKTLIWVTLILLLLFRYGSDFLEEQSQETIKIESIIGIIGNDYITVERVDPLINNYIFVEKRKIEDFRKKAITFILLQKGAEKEGLSIQKFLIEKGIIKKEEEYAEFLNGFYVNPNLQTISLIEDLKKEFFYREILF